MAAVGLLVGLVLAPTTVRAATNYFDTTKLVSGVNHATCPTGWRLTSGGVSKVPDDSWTLDAEERWGRGARLSLHLERERRVQGDWVLTLE